MKLSFPADIRAVFTDLDGTLTTGGRVLPSTIDALARLRAQGFWVVIVTGRPAGWADALIRLWPVDAVIFENGAGYYLRREEEVSFVGLAAKNNGPKERERLQHLFEKCRERVPHAHLASDQAFRLFDFAVDHSEEKPFLSALDVETVLQVLRAEPGVVAKASSTHINYLFGDHTKRTGCEALLATDGKRRGVSADQVVFIGDSLNDEPLFAYFEHCVGVANIADCWDRLSSRPKQTTKSRGGMGFEELTYCLLTP